MRKLSVEEFVKIEFAIVETSLDCLEIDNTAGEDMDWSSDDDVCYRSGGGGTIVLESACGLKLFYYFEAEGGKSSYQAAHNFSLSISRDENVELVGAELDIDVGMDDYELYFESCLTIINKTDWDVEVEKLLPTAEVVSIDDGESANRLGEAECSNMSKHILNPSNSSGIEFIGEIVAEVQSTWETADQGSYSGNPGSYNYLTLYKTDSGKYVCSNYEKSRWANSHDQHKVVVCDRLDEVIAFFGNEWLARRLYVEAEIVVKEAV